MRHLIQDLRQSFRSLLRSPIVSVVIVLTLGLAIGVNTAIFSLIQGVLLNPLVYPEPDRLVRISMQAPPDNRWPLSVADYQALERQQAVFTQVAGFRNVTSTFRKGSLVERIAGKFVTWSYFPLLGIEPVQGRLFTESEDRPEASGTVVVSHFFWQSYLQGLPEAIGQPIELDGTAYEVIGVLPPRTGELETDRHFFAAARWAEPARRGPFFIQGLGRLKPGLTREAAQQELEAITRQLFPVWAATFQSEEATWGQEDLKKVLVGDVRPTLLMVFGAVLFVFLIAAVNSAGLLVARVARRRRELAVRSALGAARFQLLQHLLAEGLWLTGGAALVAVVVSLSGIELLQAFGSEFLPRSQQLPLNGPVISFFTVCGLVSLALFGLIPAVGMSSSRNLGALRASGRGAGNSRGLQKLRRGLVMAEVAIALPLLIGGSLLATSLTRLGKVDPGFETDRLLTLQISLPATYEDATSVHTFWRRALERIESLPEIAHAGFSDGRPPSEFAMSNNVDLLDQPTPAGGTQPATPWVAVSPGFFRALGMPLMQGRLLEERDGESSSPSVVVDRAWAERFYPGGEAVGRQFYSGGCNTCPPLTVVGVVGTVKFGGLERLETGTVYWPMTLDVLRTGYLVLRTQGNPLSALPSIRRVVRELDPELPVSRVATARELMSDSLQSPRYLTVLVVVFAGTSLLLALVGIYGIMVSFVQQQVRDIGIRIAVGANRLQVLHLVLENALRLILLGTVIGLLLAAGCSRFMASLLFQVSTLEPWVFGLSWLITLLTALAASLIPAWRATRVDPVRALRLD